MSTDQTDHKTKHRTQSACVGRPTHHFLRNSHHHHTHPSSLYHPPSITSSLSQPSVLCSTIHIPMASTTNKSSNFEDHLPLMAEKLGGEGLMGELCKGFQLLKDGNKGVITFESLKKNAGLLGLQDLTDEDLKSMVREGDFDGDGALNQMEFCVLMFRLSPELMEQAEILLDEAIQQQGFQF